jgi:hypothetical protein
MNPALTAVCGFLILLCLYVVVGTIRGVKRRERGEGDD